MDVALRIIQNRNTLRSIRLVKEHIVKKLANRGLKRLSYKRHSNRVKAKSPKKIKVWCGCDRNLVAPGQKCSVCGIVFGAKKRKFKKDVDFEAGSVV